MTTLQFADTQYLVVFLSKPVESEGFEQIVDFLNANPIRYALMINLAIYTSCIEQFWATVKVKTVNEEVRIACHATIFDELSKGRGKGKGKMVKPKPVKKLSKKDQLMLDEELAFKLQAEEEEEERLAKEKS
ncbi:hypothetical protein Tco_0071268 [Tanacetum coccineum]